ncbi:MAG: hypothetical protein QS748_12780, partial [Candidatus Endonucleobacter bathymodioli]|nr:hypothetical protein [Candidatus Endonucleobacter bathymodioli]
MVKGRSPPARVTDIYCYELYLISIKASLCIPYVDLQYQALFIEVWSAWSCKQRDEWKDINNILLKKASRYLKVSQGSMVDATI